MKVKERTCSAVRLFGKKKKSRLEFQLLRVFKDMTFLRSRWFKISNIGSWRQIYLGIVWYVGKELDNFSYTGIKVSRLALLFHF